MAGGVWLFQVLALCGALAACTVTVTLAHRRGLEIGFVLVLVICTLVSQAALALFVKVLRQGKERFVLYHHGAVFVLTTSVTAEILRKPLLQWLDIVTPAFFMFIVFGRLGCWTAGCCYGRPSRFGFVYRDAHGDAIAPELRHLPLWPVQLADAVAAFVASVAGVYGASFYTCFGLYAMGRFLLEYLRGEPGRPRLLGLTEAQWTSAGLVVLAWPFMAVPLVLLAMLYRPVLPDQVIQITRAIRCTSTERTVATTSSGITVTRANGVLHVLSPATSGVLHCLAQLDELICATRKA